VRHMKHSPTQATFDFSRAEKLSILRYCRLGDPDKINDHNPLAKAMLRAIDDRIGRNESWTMLPEEVIRDADMARSTGYRILRWLAEEGFIGMAKRPDGKTEFRIYWGLVREFTPWGGCSVSPGAGPTVPERDSQSRSGTDQSRSGTHSPGAGLTYKEERPVSAPISAPPAPPSSEDATVMANVIDRLIDAGMNRAVAAMEGSLQLRTVQETAALVEYYLTSFRLPDGTCDAENNLNWLFWRLTSKDGQRLPVDKGWKKPSQAFTKARWELQERSKRDTEAAVWKAARLARRTQDGVSVETGPE